MFNFRLWVLGRGVGVRWGLRILWAGVLAQCWLWDFMSSSTIYGAGEVKVVLALFQINLDPRNALCTSNRHLEP